MLLAWIIDIRHAGYSDIDLQPDGRPLSTDRPCVMGSYAQSIGVDVLPRSGELLRITRDASVQFSAPLLFRVIRVHDWSTYDGWAWLDGYELDNAGDAVQRRSIFVRVHGVQHLSAAPTAARAAAVAR
jgi:hypothetical protein